MDQQAPHNLPFEPEDLPLAPPIPPPAPPTTPPPAVPKVDLPPASPPAAPPVAGASSRFLSETPAVQASRVAASAKQPEDMFAGLDGAGSLKTSPRVLPNDPLVTPHASYGKYILLICCLVAGLGVVGAGLWYFAIHRPAQQAEREAIVATVPTTPLAEPVANTPPATEPVIPTPSTPVPSPTTPSTATPDDLLSAPSDTAPAPVVPTTPVVTPPAGAAVPPPTSIGIPAASATTSSAPTTFVDSDADGLSDTREQELGTDPRNADTDSDGLSDGDEVLKYGTNPLKMDSDGDTYSDGLEVKGGYNPRGGGKCPKPNCVQ